MSFAFANKLGENVSESYNPYDAYQNHNYNQKKELCLISDNRVINILDTKMISVKWAISCAKHVLHLFEEQYPDDKKPRKSIEAASNWIKDPSEKNRMVCKDAYVDSYTSSRINNITKSAAYAAYASNSAAYAVYYSSFVAAYFAASDASIASPNKYLEIKWQRKKLNQIVYEDILLAFVMTQYQRIDNKLAKREVSLSTSLVRKIPKELLEYIASFIY